MLHVRCIIPTLHPIDPFHLSRRTEAQAFWVEEAEQRKAFVEGVFEHWKRRGDKRDPPTAKLLTDLTNSSAPVDREILVTRRLPS